MIAAGADDLPEVVAFWQERAETAMFPLINLRRYGLAGELFSLERAPEALIKTWMLDHQPKTLMADPELAPKRVDDAHARMLSLANHRVLMDGAEPLSMTGFTAALPDIVQLGGVYRPPEMRGRGHARRAVALHLTEVRAQGVQRATLFSASDVAARACTAIGFKRFKIWTLLLFQDAQQVGGEWH